MDFSAFDKRRYPTLSIREGYCEWAGSYEDTVLDLMDIRLLERLSSIAWPTVGHALDLACGTGRIGAWLKQAGARRVDGVDFSEAMSAKAGRKGVYDRLVLADVLATGLAPGSYDLVTCVLADEHIAELGPLYREAARLATTDGRFVLAGYHWHFQMLGVPVHFDRPTGEPVAIQSYVHLTSDHVGAAHDAGFHLAEMVEGVVDDAWIAQKPQWASYRHHPVSFALVWAKSA